MTPKLATLESRIGHTFQDIKLLERSMTHRSWAVENVSGEDEYKVHEAENESMEFLGDSVLGLIIAEQLFLRHPNMDEGDLTLMKHHLVSTATLAIVADDLKLGDFVRFGRGEEKTGGRKKQALLANTLEAVIAAVFLDGGYSAVRVFISRIFADHLKNTTPGNSTDYKSLLQEFLQSDKKPAPRYNVIRMEGPPHARRFSVEAVWETGRTQGVGHSIKSAEMMAAEEALRILQFENENDSKRT